MCSDERPEIAQLLAKVLPALKAVTDHMDRSGGDRDGMPECPWCRSGPDGDDHGGDCELVAAREAIAELDAALRASQGGRDERISLSLRLGQILGPDYDGVPMEDIARELVKLKASAPSEGVPDK